jgi:peroxiredoxin
MQNWTVLTIIALLFSSCEMVSIVDNCPGNEDLGILPLTEEAKAFIPYSYASDEQLVFKNEAEYELLFFPNYAEVQITPTENTTMVPCENGEERAIRFAQDREVMDFNSTAGIQISFSLLTENEINPENPNSIQLYDALIIRVVKVNIVDGVGTIQLDERMTIPASFRDNATFEIGGEYPFTNYYSSLTIGQQTFSDVYIKEKDDREWMAFSPNHGLLFFVDELGQKWSFDRMNILPVGQAQDFSMPNPDNEIIQLSDIEADLIILDFWASWCGPCRTANVQTLKPLYDTFQEKGLEIVSVSLDTNYDNWVAAIAEDQMNWINLSDLDGYNSSVLNLYNIFQIPSVFVLNADQEILRMDIHDEELETFVAEYLD